MRRQELTAEQYRRANRVLRFVMSAIFIIFIVVEINAVKSAGMDTARVFRIVLDAIFALGVNIVTMIWPEKKRCMVIQAVIGIVLYVLLVYGNGPGAMVMAFPMLIGFMVYLNARVITIGTVVAFLICAIRASMLKSGGDIDGFNQSYSAYRNQILYSDSGIVKFLGNINNQPQIMFNQFFTCFNVATHIFFEQFGFFFIRKILYRSYCLGIWYKRKEFYQDNVKCWKEP